MTSSELNLEIRKKKSFLCVGLDIDLARIPAHLHREAHPVFSFNRAIIDATADLAVAYKPNLAFYEALGTDGINQLEMTVDYIRSKDPNLFIIADAKRGDIGHTAEKYAKAFFFHYDFDAITLSPYMGKDSIEPFLQFPGKWAIILALTSNPGASDFQLLNVNQDQPLYEHVLMQAITWGTTDNLMFVVGATRSEHFRNIRRIAPDHFLLVPGIGAQGGSMEMVIDNGKSSKGGLLINNSRGILYAGSGLDFAEKARAAAHRMLAEFRL
ncbi:MAG: orotidine-5'-phosphate decarboxylase [Porphyromonadaceae bacterium]|nr:MAG: orotidine-5'-phosphate decarboxylase [Porphyromonadaceae bacterium]